MSELIAEARVLVTPDTTAFRSQLIAQTTAAAKGVVVPVTVTPVVSGVTGTAGTAALTAAQADLATASTATSVALAQEQALLARGGVLLDSVALKEERAAAETAGATAARRAAAASTATYTRQLGQLERGAAATGLSFLGLRGATLAASGPFIAAAAGATAFAKSIQLAVNFDQQLNVFKVTVGATADEMERVSKAAIALGQDISLPGVSAGDAAETMTELAKAGLSVQDSIDGARGVLQLATAAQLSNADATQIAAGALNAFGLAGRQAGTVADILANAANAAQGSISDMAIALGQSEAVARQVGLSINDTAAILTLLAKNGLQGSDAGTSLRVALLRLVNPTEKAKKILDELNITLRDQQGNLRPEVFAEFSEATQGMTRSQQDAKAAIVFGTDAIRAQAILGREGAAALDEMTRATERQGTAAEVAAARNAGLAGAAANLQNQLETTGLEVGQLAEGPLTVLLDILAKNVDEFNQFISVLKQLPHEIPFPNLQIGPVDTQQAGSDLAGKVTDIFKFAGSKAVLAPFTTFVPGGFATLFALEKLFPPKDKIDQGAAQAAANLRSGIEDAGREAVLAANDAGSKIERALGQAFNLFGTNIEQVLTASRKKLSQAVTGAQGQQLGLEDVFNQLLLGGASPQQQIANLRAQFADQQKQIDSATKGLIGLTSSDKGFGGFTKTLRQARAKQVQINGQIEAIQSGVVSDQQSAAAKARSDAQAAQAATDEHDRAILALFTPAQNRLNLAAITANATARLSDNVKLQDAIIAEANREVQIITDTVKNVQTKNQVLAQQAVIIKTAQTERDRLIAEIAQTATENRRKAADAITARLGQQITLAELRENDTAEVAAINRAIQNARKRIASFKKLGLNLLDEKIALEELINKRDEVLQTAKDASGVDAGTTLVDLFRSTQDIIAQAGNVGQLPGQLTSAAANQPIRDLVQQRLDIQVSNPQGLSIAKQQQTTTERLITTMEQLITTLGGQGFGVQVGNQGTGGQLSKAVDTATRFRYQRVANSLVEAGVWG